MTNETPWASISDPEVLAKIEAIYAKRKVSTEDWNKFYYGMPQPIRWQESSHEEIEEAFGIRQPQRREGTG